MKNPFYAVILTACAITIFISCNQNESGEKEEGYNGPMERALLETRKTKDPALGYVPHDRLWNALRYTEQMRSQNNFRTMSILWTERGPMYDSVGPSNGNGRGGGPGTTGGYTAGRIRAIHIDANDPTGNTVWTGGVAGGLWKTTNFLSATPTWVPIDDFFPNLAVTSICQDPTNSNIMYFSTGEANYNVDAVFGQGVWKSVDNGATWVWLPTTVAFTRIFKIRCDAAGNVYLATGDHGLRRSTDGGANWTNITPSGVQPNCTDIEFAASGRLHASFQFFFANSAYRYTDIPATVTSAGWTSMSSGLVTTNAMRLELAVKGDTVLAAPVNLSYHARVIYKSVDNGVNWTRQNAVDYGTAISNGQGWYNIALAMDPENSSRMILSGLDAYISTNNGSTMTRMTNWISVPPYVHADHHECIWVIVGTQSRIIMGTDGGIFYSNDGGMTFVDKNYGLVIKQFYSVAIHPTLTNYLLGGAQDNGSHQLRNPGLSYSFEVTGGDGAFVAIDQNQPQYQFTSYVYNQYRRSTNGGTTWSAVNLNPATGLFINPFDYDNVGNRLYSSNSTGGNGSVLRWNDPQTGNSTVTFPIAALAGNDVSAVTVSPHTVNRVYFGGHAGGIVRLDNANSVTSADVDANVIDLTIPNFSGGYISNIAVGSTDNHLMVTFSNYGFSSIWYSSDGGSNWSEIEGNLPDMPVRWAVFMPGDDDKAVIATEAGVYTTTNINGVSTLWLPSPGFPIVRTDMLKVRASDNTIVAATHGRGMFTGNILAILPIRSVTLQGSLDASNRASLTWKTIDETSNTKYHLQYSTDGVSFTEIAQLKHDVKQFKHDLTAPTGYYRIMASEPNQAPVFSNIVAVRSAKPGRGLHVRVLPNPVRTSANFIISSSTAGAYSWEIFNLSGQTVRSGKGSLTSGGSENIAVNTNQLPAGMYRIRTLQNGETNVTAFMKQ